MPTVTCLHYKAFAEPKPACPQGPKNSTLIMNDKTRSSTQVEPLYAAFVGLDWGDETHALSLCAAGGNTIEQITLEQTPEALAQWAHSLCARFPNGKIAIALEQS